MIFSLYKCIKCNFCTEDEPENGRCKICNRKVTLIESTRPFYLVKCDCMSFVGYLNQPFRCPRCGRDSLRPIDSKNYKRRYVEKYNNILEREVQPLDEIMDLIDSSIPDTEKTIVEEPVRLNIDVIKDENELFNPRCSCGCGQMVIPPTRYIRGHHLRKKKVEENESRNV